MNKLGILRIFLSDVKTLVHISGRKQPPYANKGKSEMKDVSPRETRDKGKGKSATLL